MPSSRDLRTFRGHERDQIAAVSGPRAVKERGSLPWCWQTLDRLALAWASEVDTQGRLQAVVGDIEGERVWEKVPPERPFGSRAELFRALLGVDEVVVTARLTAEERAAAPKTLHPHRRPTAEEQASKGDIITFTPTTRGTGPDYLTARIARDRPDILADMRAGKYPSVRAAAIAAGIVKPRIQIRPTPDGFAKAIRAHLSPEQISELIAVLEGLES